MSKKNNSKTNIAEEISAYETAMAFAERTTVRLWIIVIILAVLLVGTNVGWFVYESQFETISDEEYHVEQEAETDNTYSIIKGGVINGEAKDNIQEDYPKG